METAATRMENSTTGPTLHVALELGQATWKVLSTPGPGQRPREKTVRGGDQVALAQELTRAKERFGLPPDAPVICCYEAGREGFWLHRWLETVGVRNLVVDSSSIRITRRARRVKTDRLDAHQLLHSLLRYLAGDWTTWSVVHVPSEAAEAARQPSRELQTLTHERTRSCSRIRGLLAAQGIREVRLAGLAGRLGRLGRWNGQPVSAELQGQLGRELARLEQLEEQIRAVEAECRARLRQPGVVSEQVQALLRLRAIGPRSAWLFSTELFAWRQFRNRRQVGAVVGLTPTPYDSGSEQRDQGISRAGNAAVRTMATEIAWQWLRYQPQSELSQWYQRRFGHGSSRLRRIGIIALARKLLIALWRYVETGTPPAAAALKA
jgi:transposase